MTCSRGGAGDFLMNHEEEDNYARDKPPDRASKTALRRYSIAIRRERAQSPTPGIRLFGTGESYSPSSRSRKSPYVGYRAHKASARSGRRYKELAPANLNRTVFARWLATQPAAEVRRTGP